MTIVDTVSTHLVALGFTSVEAAVYVELLRESPRTAYQVAKAIGKPVANTYKAVDALRQRGVVLADATEPGLCRAVDIDEVLAQRETQFRNHRDRAAAAARQLRKRSAETQASRITTAAQALDRVRRLLASAKHVALIDAWPDAVAELRGDVERAIARGVAVGILSYSPVSIHGATVVAHANPSDVLARWPGGWLNIVTDSAHYVISLRSADGESATGLTSDDDFLSHILASGLYHELLAQRMLALVESGASRAELTRAIHAVQSLHRASMQAVAEGRTKRGRRARNPAAARRRGTRAT